jgi:hypothetical protein
VGSRNKATKTFVVAHEELRVVVLVYLPRPLAFDFSLDTTCKRYSAEDQTNVDDLRQFPNLTAALLAPDGKSKLSMVQRTDLSRNKVCQFMDR